MIIRPYGGVEGLKYIFFVRFVTVVKYYIFLTFISGLIDSHVLCAIETSQNIKEVVEYGNNIESGTQKWTGIDVSIVGKYAEKYGHPPRDPYINTDQGDLLLFVFTAAGIIGGFIIGYNYRRLFVEGKEVNKVKKNGNT